jgi:hypothetical protein
VYLFFFTWQFPPAQPTEPVSVLQINPAHAVAGAVLAKQSSVSQHATTVVVEHPDDTVYDAVHEVAVSAHE